jgi:hypothetical protein
MFAGASTSSWQDQGKFFKKNLPFHSEPIQLIEINTGLQLIRFPVELQDLTAPAAKQKLSSQSDKWSIDSTQMSLKATPAIKIKDVSSIRPSVAVEVENRVDWLKGVAFKLKNKSDKNIHFISLLLLFPETKGSGSIMAYPLHLGKIPNKTADGKELLWIKPEEETDLKISDQVYRDLVKFLSVRHPIASLNQAEIRLTLTVFEDGTAWNDGEYFQQDPSNPGRFIPMGFKSAK